MSNDICSICGHKSNPLYKKKNNGKYYCLFCLGKVKLKREKEYRNTKY